MPDMESDYQPDEFLFCFPLFALTRADNPRNVALLVTDAGVRHVVLFTDRDTATTFAAARPDFGDLKLTMLVNPPLTAEFLSLSDAPEVAIDPLPRPPTSFISMDRLHLVQQFRAMGTAP
jgi:hypothetical protein